MAKRLCIKWKYYFMLVLYQSTKFSKASKNLDTQKIYVIILKFEQCGSTIE